jgi:hypothetical protein
MVLLPYMLLFWAAPALALGVSAVPVLPTANELANYDTTKLDTMRSILAQNSTLVNATNSDGCSALIESAKLGHTLHANVILDTYSRAFPNVTEAACMKGRKALHFAAMCSVQHRLSHSLCPDHLQHTHSDDNDSHERVTLALIEHGAVIDSVDEEGRTPTHYAALNGHPDILAVLLDAGAKVDVTDRSGWTPLFYASQRGDDESVALLLRHGANAEARDWAKATPLILAANVGHVNIVESLLKTAKVNPTVADRYGKDALVYATAGGHTAVVEVLRTVLDKHLEL